MEDRTPRALDSEWQNCAEGKNESERKVFYLGAATVHRLVQDCFKRALANRRDGESEHDTVASVLMDIRACLLDIAECVNGRMSDLHAELVKQAAAWPDDAKTLEMRRRLAELFDSRFVAPSYSRARGPQSGTRRGLTRALRIGPVTNQAAPTRPPQAPEHLMRRNTCPTVPSRP
jgi:hypothetical protein